MVLYIIMEEENSLLRKLLILWHGRKFIVSLTILAAVISLAYAFYLPLIYKADCNFIPPNQYMNKLGVFVSLQDQSDRVGGLSNQSVVAESVTSSQMIMGIMKQNSVLDAITDRFSLMEVYKQKSRGKMREYIVKKLLELEEDAKSGIITVGFLDENPKRAADIANAFVEILQDKIVSLARHDAEQKRIFFEKQLFNARLYLDKVQNELIEYQEKLGGVTIPRAQMEATLRSITDLRQNIAAKQAEISAMRTYAPIMFILAASTAFSRVLTLMQVPQIVSAFILANFTNKVILLIVINIFLLLVGMVMDTTPAILILSPILLPIVAAVGMNPIHFGVVMVVNLAIGFVTPPIGVNLFVASSLTDVPVMEIAKKAMPMIIMFLIALLLITYIPAISLCLL